MSDATSANVSPANRNVYVAPAFAERTVKLGEITMNNATVGSAPKPASLLIPRQTES